MALHRAAHSLFFLWPSFGAHEFMEVEEEDAVKQEQRILIDF